MRETKGVLKARILEMLRARGPMTAAELARELHVDTKSLNGSLRALSYSGHIYPAGGGRKRGRVWAIRWIREEEEEGKEI